MNRAALIDQIQQARETLEKLLVLLKSAPVERDRFVQARKEYRRTCETAGKSGKQNQRCVISTFQIAESMGFKGECRQWEDLLRIGESKQTFWLLKREAWVRLGTRLSLIQQTRETLETLIAR